MIGINDMEVTKVNQAVILILTILIVYIFPLITICDNGNYQCDKLILNKDWEKAFRCVEQIKQSKPDWYYPYYLEAKIYLEMNDDENYLVSMKAALSRAKEDKEFFAINYKFALFYFNRWKDDEDKKSAWDYCVQSKWFAPKAKESYGQFLIFSLCGKISYKAKDYKYAEQDFKRAHDINGTDPDLNEYYIFTLCHIGKDNEAIDLLLTAPKNSATYELLSGYFIKSGRFKDAIETAKKCLNLDNDAFNCSIRLAEAYRGEKDWGMVLASLDKSLQHEQNDWRVFNLMGEAYLRLNNYKKAIECLRKACSKIEYYDCEPFVNLGLAYQGAFRVTKDETYLDKSSISFMVACRMCPQECTNKINNQNIQLFSEEIIEKNPLDSDVIEINCSDPKYKNILECIELMYPGTIDYLLDPRLMVFFFSSR